SCSRYIHLEAVIFHGTPRHARALDRDGIPQFAVCPKKAGSVNMQPYPRVLIALSERGNLCNAANSRDNASKHVLPWVIRGSVRNMLLGNPAHRLGQFSPMARVAQTQPHIGAYRQ